MDDPACQSEEQTESKDVPASADQSSMQGPVVDATVNMSEDWLPADTIEEVFEAAALTPNPR